VIKRLWLVVGSVVLATVMVGSVVLVFQTRDKVAEATADYERMRDLVRQIDVLELGLLIEERRVERYVLTGDPKAAVEASTDDADEELLAWARIADELDPPLDVGDQLREADAAYWRETAEITRRIRDGDRSAVGADAYESMASPYSRLSLVADMKFDLMDRERGAFEDLEAANLRFRYAFWSMTAAGIALAILYTIERRRRVDVESWYAAHRSVNRTALVPQQST
jgi:hypothetical protein